MTHYVTSSDIKAFANRKINLKTDEVEDGRERVKFLRERLEDHINKNPGFALVKMLHSGSVAKGTGLSNLNDMDVAVYVVSDGADDSSLITWVAERLREVYNGLTGLVDIIHQENSIKIGFSSGFNIDVVPVLDKGDPDDKGYLVKATGEKVLTSIPLHLKFIRVRKEEYSDNFRQLIRYLKWWIRIQKKQDSSFKFKSFMAELIIAYLADNGLELEDHVSALTEVFGYIVKNELDDLIFFTDYCSSSYSPIRTASPVQILDPVNLKNNVAKDYSESDKAAIVDKATIALEALVEASCAATKEQAIECWQVILGTSFKG